MLVKEWELDNYKKRLDNFNAVLIHGTDRGKVNDVASSLIKFIKRIYNGQLEVIKLSAEKLNDNDTSLLDLMNQKSIFYDRTIVLLDLDLIKIKKEDIITLRHSASSKSNLIILESAALNYDSFILKEFKKQDNLICVPCYQDNEKSIRNSISDYAKEFGLKIDKDSINHLASKMGNDKMITKSEIEKLAIFANNQPLSFADLMDGIGDNSILGTYKVTDNFLLRNEVNLNHTYDRLIESGLNGFFMVRALIKHLQALLLAKISQNKIVANMKPPLHFTRHKNVQDQLNCLNIDRIEQLLMELNCLEKNCKQSPTLSNLLVKKFLTTS